MKAGNMKYGNIYKYKKQRLSIYRTNEKWIYIKCIDKRNNCINSYWVSVFVIKGGIMEGTRVGDIIGEEIIVYPSSYAEMLAEAL